MSKATTGSDADVRSRGEDLSIAVLYPGGRSEKLLDPLRETDADVAVSPSSPNDYDVILCDQPRRNIIRPILLSDDDTPVVYRVRGNLWKENDIWRFGGMKMWVANKAIFPRLDAAIAVDNRLANMFQRKTGIEDVGVATLAKDPDRWPSAVHVDDQLDLITLTNMNYRQKIRPLFTHAEAVNEWLEKNGGHWHICGEGIFSDNLEDSLDKFEHISHEGYVEPKQWLPEMDAMLHLSNFDAFPNAVLEGMASNLPVLTNDFDAFHKDGPHVVTKSPEHLTSVLDQLTAPEEREHLGEDGRSYLRKQHTYEQVGEQYKRFLGSLT